MTPLYQPRRECVIRAVSSCFRAKELHDGQRTPSSSSTAGKNGKRAHEARRRGWESAKFRLLLLSTVNTPRSTCSSRTIARVVGVSWGNTRLSPFFHPGRSANEPTSMEDTWATNDLSQLANARNPTCRSGDRAAIATTLAIRQPAGLYIAPQSKPGLSRRVLRRAGRDAAILRVADHPSRRPISGNPATPASPNSSGAGQRLHAPNYNITPWPSVRRGPRAGTAHAGTATPKDTFRADGRLRGRRTLAPR